MTKVNFTILIDGVPLNEVIQEVEQLGSPTGTVVGDGGHDSVDLHQVAPLVNEGSEGTLTSLVGKRIVISAGHGRYSNGTSWPFQRSYFWGIVEDLVNWDIALPQARSLHHFTYRRKQTRQDEQ